MTGNSVIVGFNKVYYLPVLMTEYKPSPHEKFLLAVVGGMLVYIFLKVLFF
jgi:hypothetical protein